MVRKKKSFFKFVDILYVYSFLVLTIIAGNILLLYHTFYTPEVKDYNKQQYIEPAFSDNSHVHLKSVESLLAGKDIYSRYDNIGSKLRKLMENSGDGYSNTPPVLDFGLDLNNFLNKTSSKLLNCNDIDRIEDRSYIASGWTKAVFKGRYNGKYVAVKTIDVKGQDVTTCVQDGGMTEQCYRRAAKKIVKEFIVLNALARGNLVKVLGFCYSDDSNSGAPFVAMVTELGEPIDLIKILQMSWEDRLRMSYDVTRLVAFLAKTEHGSTSLNDFRRQQFVLVDGELKLSDVDDVGFGDPQCSTDEECTVVFSSGEFSQRLACVNGKCGGYNEKCNIYNTGRHFTTFLLPHGAPAMLKPHIDEVVDGFSNLTMPASELVARLDDIVRMYREGKHMNRSRSDTTDYKMLPNRDIPGKFDYKCHFTVSGDGCAVSVFDIREAEELCNSDPDCQSFVTSESKTWAGRTVVHFKNGYGESEHRSGTTLYVKPQKYQER